MADSPFWLLTGHLRPEMTSTFHSPLELFLSLTLQELFNLFVWLEFLLQANVWEILGIRLTYTSCRHRNCRKPFPYIKSRCLIYHACFYNVQPDLKARLGNKKKLIIVKRSRTFLGVTAEPARTLSNSVATKPIDFHAI
jgi:hypothetical protein